MSRGADAPPGPKKAPEKAIEDIAADVPPQDKARSLHVVGQLAGGIAHDFNNLLTAILGAADAILARTDTTAETADDAQQIRHGVERGAALVRQLLAFSRQQTLVPRVVAVNAAIEDAARLLHRLLGEKVTVMLALEQPGRRVLVDPGQLDQVLVNLAVNARDAMADGGTLTLSSGHATLYRPRLTGTEAIPPGRYVTITVADTGSGIPDDVLPRIFEPFFTTKHASGRRGPEGGGKSGDGQGASGLAATDPGSSSLRGTGLGGTGPGDPSSGSIGLRGSDLGATSLGGTGLGLSTVLGIVRQSGGFLDVVSRPGIGTSVVVYLPRHVPADAEIAPTPPTTVAAPARGGDRVALVAEDEAPVRLVLARALTRAGWRVLAAETAEVALEQLASLGDQPKAHLSVVISDVVMPGMDGPALVRAVRQRCPGVPAVLVSGYAEPVLRADLATMDIAFLAKPYATADLLGLVARLTSAQAADKVTSKADGLEGAPVEGGAR